jgi:hypothetical protein
VSDLDTLQTNDTSPNVPIQDWADDLKAKRQSPLSRDERRQLIRLRHAEGLTIAACARAMNRAYSGVYEFLQPYESTVDMADAKLKANAETAADAWVKSLDIAAAKGEHKPAQALLEAVGVVKPHADTQVGVVVNMPGCSAPKALPELDFSEDA